MTNSTIINVYKAIAVTPAGRKLVTDVAVDYRTATAQITAIFNSQYGRQGEWTFEVEPMKTGTRRVSL
jgi:hypothetical protein